tara:strand:- start:471 stop:662 length:192 start_codon:yes stop_codon:yes gene_type:complete
MEPIFQVEKRKKTWEHVKSDKIKWRNAERKKKTEKISNIFFPIDFFREITGIHTHSIERSAPG